MDGDPLGDFGLLLIGGVSLIALIAVGVSAWAYRHCRSRR